MNTAGSGQGSRTGCYAHAMNTVILLRGEIC
jgi:hypothetical protein